MIILNENAKLYKLAALKQYKVLNGFAFKIIKVLLMLTQMFSTISKNMLTLIVLLDKA
jgi:hypothetical protein